MDTPARLATPPVDIDALAARLLSDDTLQLGQCRLMRNETCDCVVGTDPFGIDAIAAYSASPKGCLDAVQWAVRASMLAKPRVI